MKKIAYTGVETVSNVLCKSVQFLVENPDIQERLYVELKNEFSDGITYEKLTQCAYLDAFLNESMRLGPPLFILVKRASIVSNFFHFDKFAWLLINDH